MSLDFFGIFWGIQRLVLYFWAKGAARLSTGPECIIERWGGAEADDFQEYQVCSCCPIGVYVSGIVRNEI